MMRGIKISIKLIITDDSVQGWEVTWGNLDQAIPLGGVRCICDRITYFEPFW